MTEVGKRYQIVRDIVITITDGREDYDYLFGPGDGELSFNGSDIIFHSLKGKGGDYTTIMFNGCIDDMVERGYLIPSEKDEK